MEELLRRLLQIQASASPAPWTWTYGFNSGGVATGLFTIPQHLHGESVEMLAGDAAACAELRNLLPQVIAALRALSKLSTSELRMAADAIEEAAKNGDPQEFGALVQISERLRAIHEPDLAADLQMPAAV